MGNDSEENHFGPWASAFFHILFGPVASFMHRPILFMDSSQKVFLKKVNNIEMEYLPTLKIHLKIYKCYLHLPKVAEL